MNLLLRLGIFLAVLVLALFLFTQVIRRTSMFFPDRYPVGEWNTKALPIQPSDETFTASDGVSLHGWLFRSSDPHAPLLIWMHGNGGNLTGRAPIAAELARRGVSVLLFDWRGYGKSQGTASESGLYRDALAAYDFGRTKTTADLVLYGESVGGPYAAYAAANRKARCVIIENSFPSLAAVGNVMYHPLPLGWFAPRAMTTLRWLNDAGIPVLVMHGRRDHTLPFGLGLALFDGLRVPKEMFISETADHGEIPEVEGARYYDKVVQFITAGPQRTAH